MTFSECKVFFITFSRVSINTNDSVIIRTVLCLFHIYHVFILTLNACKKDSLFVIPTKETIEFHIPI